MKTLENPTKYFFKHADNYPDLYRQQINEFSQKLLNSKTCLFCKLPRILIHCGHTLCSQCLLNFFRDSRVRCPLCLKLIKHLDGIDLLPINHTIFTKMTENHNKTDPNNMIDPNKYLYRAFDVASKRAKQNQVGFRVDPQTGIPLCLHHTERLQHFYCLYHKAMCCRLCAQTGHTRNQCVIVDLYEVENWQAFVQNDGMIPQNGNQNGNQNENINLVSNNMNVNHLNNNIQHNNMGQMVANNNVIQLQQNINIPVILNQNAYENFLEQDMDQLQRNLEEEYQSDSFSSKSI